VKHPAQQTAQPSIREVVETILTGYGPVEKILLFGSAARGCQDESSDLDLIIIKRTSERFLKRILSVPLLPVRAHLFVYTPEEFAEMQEHENPFILEALRDARLVYPPAHDPGLS
jgi:predicted nucleotidyltransferase